MPEPRWHCSSLRARSSGSAWPHQACPRVSTTCPVSIGVDTIDVSGWTGQPGDGPGAAAEAADAPVYEEMGVCSELPVREAVWGDDGELLVYGGTATPE